MDQNEKTRQSETLVEIDIGENGSGLVCVCGKDLSNVIERLSITHDAGGAPKVTLVFHSLVVKAICGGAQVKANGAISRFARNPEKRADIQINTDGAFAKISVDDEENHNANIRGYKLEAEPFTCPKLTLDFDETGILCTDDTIRTNSKLREFVSNYCCP